MTTVYLDTSALLKRVLVEPESEALTAALRVHADRRDLLTSSSLAWVEVWRSLGRIRVVTPQGAVNELAENALAGVAELALDTDVLNAARTVGTGPLRTLDAIHLASAVKVSADLVLTYDERLTEAATGAGLLVEAPA